MRRILILSLALLGACQPLPQPGPAPAVLRANHAGDIHALYPAAPGASWTYDLEQTQNGQPNTAFKEMTLTIERRDSENGVETALMRRSYPNSAIQPHPTRIQRFPDRIELSRAAALLDAPTRASGSIAILRAPLQTGNQWEGRQFQGGTETIRLAGQERLTVPAGTFTAWKVNHHLIYDNGRADDLYYWYAPGVGTVKMHEELTLSLNNQWIKLRAVGVLRTHSQPKTYNDFAK